MSTEVVLAEARNAIAALIHKERARIAVSAGLIHGDDWLDDVCQVTAREWLAELADRGYIFQPLAALDPLPSRAERIEAAS